MGFKLNQATAELLSQATFTMQPLENVRCLSMVDVVVTKTGSVISTAIGEHVQVCMSTIFSGKYFDIFSSTASTTPTPKRNVIVITVSFTGDDLETMVADFAAELTTVFVNNGYEDAAIVFDVSYDDKDE